MADGYRSNENARGNCAGPEGWLFYPKTASSFTANDREMSYPVANGQGIKL